MADLTYGDLENLTYSALEGLTYAFETTTSGGDSGDDSSGSGESSGTGCVWTSDRIAAIESQLSAILSRMDTLAEKSDVQLTTTTQEVDLSEVLSKMDTLAKPEDVKVTVSADGIEVPTAADVSTAVWTHGTRTLTEYPASESIDLSEVTDKLETIFALIARWSVSGNVLTAYTSSGATLGTFTLTRDAAGEIVGVTP